MKEVIADIDRWQAAGRRVAIARVIGVEGSGPRDPGATMAVNEDGEVAGSVSGGCVEGAVVDRGACRARERDAEGVHLRIFGRRGIRRRADLRGHRASPRGTARLVKRAHGR